MKFCKGIGNVLKSIFLVFAVCAGAVMLQAAGKVHAEEIPEYRIQVTPATLNIELDPGVTKTVTFEVQNTGSKEFKFKVSISPYSVKDPEYSSDFSSTTKYTDIANWIEFSETEGTVEPNGSEKIEATVSVPKDVPAGGQYAVILAQIVDESDGGEGSGVSITKQVGIVVYSNVEGKTRIEGKIEENKISGFLFQPPINATSIVENTGNTHIEAEYILQVFPLFGKEEAYTNEESPLKRVILPETRRSVEMTWDGAPKLGIFRVKQTVKAFGETSVTEKLVFICPIWFLFIIILIVFCVIFWIVSRVRNRNKE